MTNMSSSMSSPPLSFPGCAVSDSPSNHGDFRTKVEATLSTLAAMRRKEAAPYYETANHITYIDSTAQRQHQQQQHQQALPTLTEGTVAATAATSDQLHRCCTNDVSSCSSSSQSRTQAQAQTTPQATPQTVNAAARRKMVLWCYQVVDFYLLDRDLVAISMSYVDRYLQCNQRARRDRHMFQLVSMTALYLSVKLYAPRSMSCHLIAKLSRGAYTAQQVVRMEEELLFTLLWHVHPPTASTFVACMLDLIPEPYLMSCSRATVRDMAMYQTQVAVCDSGPCLLSAPPSAIAHAAVLNALASCLGVGAGAECCAATTGLDQVASVLGRAVDLQQTSAQVAMIRNHLCAAVLAQPVGKCPTATADMGHDASVYPVSTTANTNINTTKPSRNISRNTRRVIARHAYNRSSNCNQRHHHLDSKQTAAMEFYHQHHNTATNNDCTSVAMVSPGPTH